MNLKMTILKNYYQSRKPVLLPGNISSYKQKFDCFLSYVSFSLRAGSHLGAHAGEWRRANIELECQIRVYDHLTPKTQDLLFQASICKRAYQFKFCWAKNGFFFLRKSESSPIVKLHCIEDLRTLEQSLRSADANDDNDDGPSQS